ncbi:MAG TPA: GMC family oxidoreductase [Gemmatimonadales bacterium]|nr:GMC family oxidoreductase [Gemmatimonadales bacterium]
MTARHSVGHGGPTYRPSDEVDFLVVGAGAAGGVMARELAQAGFQVLVLEQGPRLGTADFQHDEYAVSYLSALTNNYKQQPTTLRRTATQKASIAPAVGYGRCVGGGTVHFTGNYWRFHEIDFVERSRKGAVPGADLDDWPISYADLEPYYTRVEWEIGVSGLAGSSPFDPPRSKPYPLPPLPIKSTGVLAERAAKKLGWTAFPAPMAILSQPYRGRPGCIHCGWCETFGCEVNAKSSTLVTMIPEAEATGRCEIRPNSYVRKIETNSQGRVTGVKYFDGNRREVFQRAKAVVVSANGAETPRLLLMSRSNRFPDGLANSSGMVGRHLMFNGGSFAAGVFEGEINGYKGVVDSRVIHDVYELDPGLGIAGGGGFDFRFDATPIAYGVWGMGERGPRWGPAFKRRLQQYNHVAYVLGHSTSLPVSTNTVSLDPDVKDAWGLPAIRVTFQEHPNDHRLSEYLTAKSLELLDAAGAREKWSFLPGPPAWPQVHLLGTCRMGNDPRTSVVNRFHQAHDVPNLFIVDGSNFVTSGRGQPTMTIQALAFRAAEHAAEWAKASG